MRVTPKINVSPDAMRNRNIAFASPLRSWIARNCSALVSQDRACGRIPGRGGGPPALGFMDNSRASRSSLAWILARARRVLDASRISRRLATTSAELRDVRRRRVGIFLDRFQVFLDHLQRGSGGPA